jgi:hypothetical protein
MTLSVKKGKPFFDTSLVPIRNIVHTTLLNIVIKFQLLKASPRFLLILYEVQ